MRPLRTLLRAVLPAACGLALVTSVAAPPAQAADLTATFTPGAAWTDTAGNPLQMHGLGIIQVGSTWYAYGEDKTGETSSDASFQDIPCYSSTNLKTWTLQGDALTLQSSGDLGPDRVVERPKVIYNSSTHEYVMWMHIDNSGYSAAEAGVAESSTPCGPYTYLGASQPLGFQSRDIGLFQDSNGTAYLLTEDRANGLRIDELASNYLSVVSAGSSNGGSVALLADYEAPAMVHVGSTYYLLASHLTGWSTNDNVYATASSPAGPWSAVKNFAPAGTDTYNTQTANIIPVTGSSGTTYIYAGDRWTTSNLGTSPLIWLPLDISGTTVDAGWQNSWTLDLSTGTWTGTSDPANATHYLTNANSGQVMDVSGSSTANGGKVIQWTGHSGTNQQWTLKEVAGNVYTLTNVNSGLCLDVPSASTTEGLQLDQWTCNGATNQEWALNAVGSYTSSSDASYELASLSTGQVADVSGSSTTAGAIVDQWPTNGGANQEWTLG
ncbi:RICIN domain-containing protein [Actinospica durhamensis]|uniref:RICIN domain-containing protein n=1 Tax=Actinospica durhamensis TaxID=1508375 RepID=A0A941EZ02_9ACTN|nr:RICIN domain-containing protein [Actinospica durhamensis]MBR7839047.1 RICIN domain-containing protein [Actinospica durhamensis]